MRTWLRSQGFALEYEAARHLKAAGFHAVQGRTYQDAATEKTREIDVVARALLTKAQAALF
ncbi:MAG TPA: hypothetical protein VL687_08010, partial [Methylomirabilota bacterium]|nr:hypothetical protein [Methylomirabilota bacterium]